jgi:hypothetical protein
MTLPTRFLAAVRRGRLRFVKCWIGHGRGQESGR